MVDVNELAFLLLSDTHQLDSKQVNLQRLCEARGFEYNAIYQGKRPERFAGITRTNYNAVSVALYDNHNEREKRYRGACGLALLLLTGSTYVPKERSVTRHITRSVFEEVPGLFELADSLLVYKFSSREMRLLGNPRTFEKTVSKLATIRNVSSEVIVRRFRALSAVNTVVKEVSAPVALSEDANTKNFLDHLQKI
jgi:hypothetical protein